MFPALRYVFPLLALWLLVVSVACAQERQLAEQYFADGEYGKAATLYLKLYQEQPGVDLYLERYTESVIGSGSFSEVEQFLRKEQKRRPKVMQPYISLATVLRAQERHEEAAAEYDRAIAELTPDHNQINRLASALVKDLDYAKAAEVYARGAKLLKDPYIFAFNLGELYRRAGDVPRMIEQYLAYLRQVPQQISTVQMVMQRSLADEDHTELQSQLYEAIASGSGSEIPLIEMLTWSFLQRKDYRNALRQVKALDQKLQEQGNRVFDLGMVALNEQDYLPAIDAFTYIVEFKGKSSPYYLEARKQMLKARRQVVLTDPTASGEGLRVLESEYRMLIADYGITPPMAPLMIELAELEAIHLLQLDTAIAVLEQVVEMPGLQQDIRSQAKLALGDYYLIHGDVWDATLLYSQVDKLYKDDPLGHEARFRNARLSYFNRDFEWAQTQFNVLKASTSKLIANDALDLSVFIMDNSGLDTTYESMGLYADAEMLLFQNRHEEALQKLDTLVQRFPFHSLEDDVLYLKARIYLKERDFGRAATTLQRIVDQFTEEIRADNALYMLGDLYSGPLQDPAKAMTYYEKLFTDHSDSMFAADARKQFRRLRGDKVQ